MYAGAAIEHICAVFSGDLSLELAFYFKPMRRFGEIDGLDRPDSSNCPASDEMPMRRFGNVDFSGDCEVCNTNASKQTCVGV